MGLLKNSVLAMLLPCCGWAQAPAGVANATVFGGGGDSARIQAAWQIDPAVLHYKTDSVAGGIRAEYVTSVRLLKEGAEVRREAWRVRTPLLQTPSEIGGLELTDGWNVPATAGSYEVQISLFGPDWGGQAVQLSLPVAVPVYSEKEKTISPPQLLDTAYAVPLRHASPFARAGRMHKPLPTNFLGEEKRQLHFYAEAYNFKESDFKKGALRWQARIGKAGEESTVYNLSDSLSTGNSLEGSLNIAPLPTGNYILKVGIVNAKGTEVTGAQCPFQRSNVGYKPPVDTTAPAAGGAIGLRGKPVDLKNSFVGKFTEEQLPKVLRMLLPLANPEEGLAIQQLGGKVETLYRQSFIYTFWLTRSPEDPEAGWKAYADKVRTVNREFKTANRVGYETDRGRVYLHNGPPAERIKVVQESGSLPYEVWKYTDAEGHSGAFLFYQPAGPLDDYAQLHSTVAGAVKNYNWRRFLYTGGLNERSRAEQYFPERN